MKAQSVDPENVVAAFDKRTVPGSFETAFGPGHMDGGKRFGVKRVIVRPMPPMDRPSLHSVLDVGIFDQ